MFCDFKGGFEEVVWENVRCLPGGECVSLDGTHLGHDIPAACHFLLHFRTTEDGKGNRYCINLVSVAGNPPVL